jgi:hypothetical protein
MKGFGNPEPLPFATQLDSTAQDNNDVMTA